MNGLDKLEEIKNGLIGHCKSSYLKDQPNNELGKVIMVYEGMFNAIEKELKVNKALKDRLDYNTMFRVLPYEVARQVADYLEQNEDIKKWLKEE